MIISTTRKSFDCGVPFQLPIVSALERFDCVPSDASIRAVLPTSWFIVRVFGLLGLNRNIRVRVRTIRTHQNSRTMSEHSQPKIDGNRVKLSPTIVSPF